MIQIIKKKVAQPSTWIGVASAVLAIIVNGWAVVPENVGIILTSFGLIAVDA